MSDLFAAELLKLRTTRTFAAMVAVATGLLVVVVTLTTLLTDDWSRDDVHDLLASDSSSAIVLLLGVIGMTGEWRHRTITSTVLAAPDRVRLLAAKVLAYAVAGVVLSLIVSVVLALLAMVILGSKDEVTPAFDDVLDVLWRNLLQAALLGALGVCVGAVVRQQMAAVIGVLVISFVVEPALLGLASDVGRFGPFVGAPSGISAFASDADDDTLAASIATLVMLGWIAGTFALGATLLRGRDLT